MRGFAIFAIIFVMLSACCSAEGANEPYNIGNSGLTQPEAVYYPEFTFEISPGIVAENIVPGGRKRFECEEYAADYVRVSYVPYSDLHYAADGFDANTFIPGSYEFRAHFADAMYYYGGNRIEHPGDIAAGDRCGFAACFSQDGEGINIYNLRICHLMVPGDDGCLIALALIGGKEEEVMDNVMAFCYAMTENLSFNGEEVELI